MKRNVGYYGFEIALSIRLVEKGWFAGLAGPRRSMTCHTCTRCRCYLEPLAQSRSNLSLRDTDSSHSGGRPRIGIPARKGETWWCVSGATPRRGGDRGITSSSHHIGPPTQCPLGFHCRTALKDFIEITLWRSTCEWLILSWSNPIGSHRNSL